MWLMLVNDECLEDYTLRIPTDYLQIGRKIKINVRERRLEPFEQLEPLEWEQPYKPEKLNKPERWFESL